VNHHRDSQYKTQVEGCNKKSEDPTATILMTYEKALEQVEKETAAPEKSKTKRKNTKKKASNSK
jgi:flagellin-specific chaperone FliS